MIFHYNVLVAEEVEELCLTCWARKSHQAEAKIVYFDLETADSLVAIKAAKNLIASYGGKIINDPGLMFGFRNPGCKVISGTGGQFGATISYQNRPPELKPLFSEEGWSEGSYELMIYSYDLHIAAWYWSTFHQWLDTITMGGTD